MKENKAKKCGLAISGFVYDKWRSKNNTLWYAFLMHFFLSYFPHKKLSSFLPSFLLVAAAIYYRWEIHIKIVQKVSFYKKVLILMLGIILDKLYYWKPALMDAKKLSDHWGSKTLIWILKTFMEGLTFNVLKDTLMLSNNRSNVNASYFEWFSNTMITA